MTKSNSFKRKIRNFISDTYKKLTNTAGSIKNEVIFKKVYLKGEEPPKSYAFQKKFIGLYIFFAIVSFLLLWGVNNPKNIIIIYLTFGNPFAFGNAAIAMYLVLSFILSIDKIRYYIFEEFSIIKQILIFGVIFAGLFMVSILVSTNINFISYLLGLSFIWILLLSSRFYIYSRKFSTKIEAQFIQKYSISRYLIILIVPVILLVILVIISIFYRTFLVFLSLDFFGPSSPSEAVRVYNIEMKIVMPLIYFSLVMTFVFIILEFVSTRRKLESRRSGAFDNFTFSLIVFFIFFFQLFQMSMFLILRPETIDALKATIGATGTTVTYIFFLEFFISMVFLYRVILKIGKSYGWRILFFKRDGLILFFLSCVLAQTLTRFALSNEITNQEITVLGNIFLADKYLISILMIVFLGATLLIYYIKPHQTSMFLRLQKETVSEEEKAMDMIYNLIRREYIRRGEAFPLEILERELIKSTKLSKAIIYSLITRLVEKDVDIVLRETKDDYNRKIKWIDFVSVTEKFERHGTADKKARKYLSERLIEFTSVKNKDMSKLGSNLKTGKASDQFIDSLMSSYDNRQEQSKSDKQIKELKEFSFKPEDLTEETKSILLQIIKEEYKYRIEQIEHYKDIFIPISEIANLIQYSTKITSGNLYPILEFFDKNDVEIKLVENPENSEDKKIRIIPFSDDQMNFLLAQFRPEEYKEIRKYISQNFLKCVEKHSPTKNMVYLYRNKYINENWKPILGYLRDNIKSYTECFLYNQNVNELVKQINLIKNSKSKKERESNSPQKN
ncbi:MAG: hypothetical protein EU543_01720 [Promethearchaeota archaeon]|nr:MAG: hypothetical protein EU543_01720 [Candidatus Lokiarchaeota archaeon]